MEIGVLVCDSLFIVDAPSNSWLHTAVDGGTTATYFYDALNHRVRETIGSSDTDYGFNTDGQRVTSWSATSASPTLIAAYAYWNGRPLVTYNSSNNVFYSHQDLLGTKRLTTNASGTPIGTFASLPFGDGYTPTGTDPDPSHFAMLDHDAESNTDHAQFRQYTPTAATWMSPDPYDGSYNQMDPQSLNRYVYAGNNPLLYVDPSGEDYTICGTNQDASSGKIVVTCFSLPGQPLPVVPVQLLFFLESLAMRTIQNFNPGGPGSSGGQQGGSTGSGGSGAQAPSNAPAPRPKSPEEQCMAAFTANSGGDHADARASATMPTKRSALSWVVGGGVAGASGGPWGSVLGALGGFIGVFAEPGSYAVQSGFNYQAAASKCYGTPLP